MIVEIPANSEQEVGGLAPGNYQAFAFESRVGLDSADLDEISKYLAQAAQITLSAGATSAITVDLIRTGE